MKLVGSGSYVVYTAVHEIAHVLIHPHFCITQKSQDWHHQEPGENPGVKISSRFEQLVLRALSEEIISMSKGGALLGTPIEDLRTRLSDFA